MQLSRKEILEKLKDVMVSITEDEPEKFENASEETRLVEDLGLNSVGMIYLVLILEESFQIKFDDVGSATFNTVGKVVDYIEGKL